MKPYFSGHILELRCDYDTPADGIHNAGHRPSRFEGTDLAECLRKARAQGWTIHRDRTATCPEDHAPDREAKLLLELEETVRSVLNYLDRDDFPRAGICSHLGVWAKCANLSLSFLSRDGQMLINASRSTYGATRAMHATRAAAIARGANALAAHTWNGGEGHDSVSVVLNRPTPVSLARACAAYCEVKDVFNNTSEEKARFAEFSTWFARRSGIPK